MKNSFSASSIAGPVAIAPGAFSASVGWTFNFQDTKNGVYLRGLSFHMFIRVAAGGETDITSLSQITITGIGQGQGVNGNANSDANNIYGHGGNQDAISGGYVGREPVVIGAAYRVNAAFAGTEVLFGYCTIYYDIDE
jgi:hypothetical protein